VDCIIGVDSIWNSFGHQFVSLYTVECGVCRVVGGLFSVDWRWGNMSESGSWNFSHGKNQQRERASDSHTVPLIFVRLVERREKWKFWEKGNFEHDSHLSCHLSSSLLLLLSEPNSSLVNTTTIIKLCHNLITAADISWRRPSILILFCPQLMSFFFSSFSLLSPLVSSSTTSTSI